MPTNADLLKTAAAEIEARDASLAELTAKVASLEADNATLAEAVKANTGSQQKTAADLAPLAKLASDALLDKGMVKNAEAADKVASEIISSHASALRAIAKVASHLPGAQKLGTVVLTEDHKSETANEAWDRSFGTRL